MTIKIRKVTILKPMHDARYIAPVRTRFVGDLISTIVKPILSGISSVLSVFVNTLMKSLIDIIKNAFPGLYNMFQFAEIMFRRIYDTVLRTTINVITTVTRQGREALILISRVINSAVNALFKALNAMLQNVTSILQMITTMTDYMVVGMSLLFEQFNSTISKLTLTSSDSQNLVIRKVKTRVNDIISGVYNNITISLNPIVSKITNMRTETQRMVSDLSLILERKIKHVFKPIIDYLSDISYRLNSMANSVSVVLNRVVDDCIITVYRVGVDSTNGIVTAISSFEKYMESYVNENMKKVRHIQTTLTQDLHGHLLIGTCLGLTAATFII